MAHTLAAVFCWTASLPAALLLTCISWLCICLCCRRAATASHLAPCSQRPSNDQLAPAATQQPPAAAAPLHLAAGVLGENVKVTRDKTKLTVTSEIPMSKRYLKYLTKKYLKKVRGWLCTGG